MPLSDWIKSGAQGIVQGLGDTAANIIGKLKADPTKSAEYDMELKKAQLDASIQLSNIANDAEKIQAQELESVNQTIREESKSEHWAVWLWRPFIGFTFAAILVNNYILLPYFKRYGLAMIDIPAEVWQTLLVILGVASAGRSAKHWQLAKNKGL